MNKHLACATLSLSLSLTFAALDASAQVDPNQPSPPPPIANPPGSPWGTPPPPASDGAVVVQEVAPVYAPQQPVYIVPTAQSPYARRRPTRIPYEGGPVPPGGRLETRPRLGLTIGGGVTFGTTWVLTALIGAVAGSISDTASGSGGRSTAWWLVAPVVGPVAFGLANNDSIRSGGWFVLALDSIAQGAGLAMLIYGVTNPATYVVFDGLGRRQAPARPRWALLPGNAATPSGATLALTF